ncbi:unnamed protein product [Pylaiella littoralis]
MEEDGLNREYAGSGEEEESLEESIGSMTDGSASIIQASDSDGSVATRCSAPGRGETDSVASTSPSARSKGARRLTRTSRAKGGARRGRNKRVSEASQAAEHRTKEETLHLIKLRDDMISAKHQEVLLLSRQNQGLREGIDAVEKEMASLHGMIETKDDAVQKLKRESDRLRREIKRLHIEGEEHKGEENAIVVAATQNSRLLKLLEQEEVKREDVLSERDEALAQVSELKLRVRTSDERHAKRTSGLEVKLIKAIGENLALHDKYSGTDERIAMLEKELEGCRKQAIFDKETAQAALSNLRQSQYEALSQLQVSRDELQRIKDEVETKSEKLEVRRQQSAELEIRLGTLQSDLSSVERAASEQAAAADEDSRIAQARLSKELSLSESLHNKVASMSRTTLRLVERHKDLQAEVEKRQAEISRLCDQIEKMGKRELRLQQKIVRLESSLSLEVTHKRLHGALDTFNSQMVIKSPSPVARVEEKSSHTAASADEHNAATDKERASWSRRQLLSKYIALFRLAANPHDGTAAGHAVKKLDLSGCDLDDIDVHKVIELVHSCPFLEVLDLSTNCIGDAGVASLGGSLRETSCGLNRINLRGNQMSMEGIRILAKALEESGSRGISHVYVHSEGRIDALGRRNEDTRKVSCFGTQAGEVQDALESFFSVVVVDARDNKPRKTDTPKTVLPAPCRNKRQLGGVASAVSIGGQKKKLPTKPKRNGENSAIVRQNQVRDYMTKAAYRHIE